MEDYGRVRVMITIMIATNYRSETFHQHIHHLLCSSQLWLLRFHLEDVNWPKVADSGGPGLHTWFWWSPKNEFSPLYHTVFLSYYITIANFRKVNTCIQFMKLFELDGYKYKSLSLISLLVVLRAISFTHKWYLGHQYSFQITLSYSVNAVYSRQLPRRLSSWRGPCGKEIRWPLDNSQGKAEAFILSTQGTESCQQPCEEAWN